MKSLARRLGTAAAAATFALGCSAALAQAPSGTTAASAPRAAASAARPGMGMKGWRAGEENTPGWSMMSREERQQHHDRMMSMSDHGGCTAYMAQHHSRMSERARQRGAAMPAPPRQDPCGRLKP